MRKDIEQYIHIKNKREDHKQKQKTVNCVILKDFFKTLWKASAIFKHENWGAWVA